MSRPPTGSSRARGDPSFFVPASKMDSRVRGNDIVVGGAVCAIYPPSSPGSTRGPSQPRRRLGGRIKSGHDGGWGGACGWIPAFAGMTSWLSSPSAPQSPRHPRESGDLCFWANMRVRGNRDSRFRENDGVFGVTSGATPAMSPRRRPGSSGNHRISSLHLQPRARAVCVERQVRCDISFRPPIGLNLH
jgi:hypothetical protein